MVLNILSLFYDISKERQPLGNSYESGWAMLVELIVANGTLRRRRDSSLCILKALNQHTIVCSIPTSVMLKEAHFLKIYIFFSYRQSHLLSYSTEY